MQLNNLMRCMGVKCPVHSNKPLCLSVFAPEPRDGLSKCHFNAYEKSYFDTYVYVLYMNESFIPKVFEIFNQGYNFM